MKNIRIKEILGNKIILRSSISHIAERVDNDTCCLDFSGVEFISRSFADELYSFIEKGNISLEITNTNEVVKAIMQAVEHTHTQGRKHIQESITISKASTKQDLLEFLSTF